MCAGIQELERGKGEHNAFFYTTHKQVLQIILILN